MQDTPSPTIEIWFENVVYNMVQVRKEGLKTIIRASWYRQTVYLGTRATRPVNTASNTPGSFAMICVGIDVGKDRHDCIIISSEGEVLAGVYTTSNNMERSTAYYKWRYFSNSCMHIERNRSPWRAAARFELTTFGLWENENRLYHYLSYSLYTQALYIVLFWHCFC